MVIDTTSREGMERSLSHLMGISVPELYQYIKAAADAAVEDQHIGACHQCGQPKWGCGRFLGLLN